MTIVELNKKTHALLSHIKDKMKKTNPPIYKINNNTVIHHALTKVEEKKDYEIKSTD